MEMDTSCRTQDSRKAYESLPWCVMLTLKKNSCKSIFCFLSRFLFKSIKNRQNQLYTIDQKQRNNSKDAQIYYPSIQNNVLLPLREPVLPLCAILRAKSRWLPIMNFLSLVGEMWKKLLLENIRKILGSKIVQVKGLMPPGDGISRETPTDRAVGRNVV